MNFTDKTCVISGGAKGIGQCLTREFAKLGAKIAFIDRDENAGNENNKYLQDNNYDSLFFCGDISREDVLIAFVNDVISKYGNIDYLINNACFSRAGILSGCSYEDFNQVLRTGITAPYMLSKLFLPYFNAGASIVNISSTRAAMSQMNTESYTAAKGGISALTHALAISLAGRVRVNCVSPGWIDVRADYDENNASLHSESDKLQHPAKRIGKPQDIARAVIFLCDEENSFITGENITVDGGMTKLMIYSQDHGWSYKD